MAVKAAFQLGLHSPLSYEEHRVHDSELRKRLWYGLINQDRSLSISLGRPFLIPPQYVRIQKPQDPSASINRTPIATQDGLDTLHYFNCIISLNSIKATAVESLYDYNIETLTSPALRELMSRQFQLSCQLEQWRDETSSFCNVLSGSDLDTTSAASYDMKRLQILLSIEYYNTVLLISSPVLTGVLSQAVRDEGASREANHVLEAARRVIVKDCLAAEELLHIIHRVTVHGGMFLDCNAVWWTCNDLGEPARNKRPTPFPSLPFPLNPHFILTNLQRSPYPYTSSPSSSPTTSTNPSSYSPTSNSQTSAPRSTTRCRRSKRSSEQV